MYMDLNQFRTTANLNSGSVLYHKVHELVKLLFCIVIYSANIVFMVGFYTDERLVRNVQNISITGLEITAGHCRNNVRGLYLEFIRSNLMTLLAILTSDIEPETRYYQAETNFAGQNKLRVSGHYGSS